MLYPIYAAAALVCLSTVGFFVTLRETREFIGEKGVEYCWMYGSFDRYFYVHVGSICVDIAALFGLYWLAKRNHLLVYLLVWAVWLLGEPLLSFFNISFC
jgi:hypothetical protein